MVAVADVVLLRSEPFLSNAGLQTVMGPPLLDFPAVPAHDPWIDEGTHRDPGIQTAVVALALKPEAAFRVATMAAETAVPVVLVAGSCCRLRVWIAGN